MEESKSLQSFYSCCRIVVYVLILVEFFEYTITKEDLDKVLPLLGNFHERIGRVILYKPGNLHYSKIATLLMVAITCIGTKNKKNIEFDARRMVFWPLVMGMGMTLLSIWFFYTDILKDRFFFFYINIWLYIIFSLWGVISVHTALDNISKHIKDGIMKDRFNLENESFEQNEEFKETKYSVNIPMRYYYDGKFRKGWININNPFRGTFVIGTPGSGKTFAVVEPFIRQQSQKGFSMVVYDYKFPTLATKLYYQYQLGKKKGTLPKGCKFNIINFVNVEYSKRVNPLQHKYIPDLAAAQETAETLVESLQKGKKEGGGGSDQFFQTSAVNFLAACIFFFVNYKRLPYDAGGNPLMPEYAEDPDTHHKKLTGRVFDEMGNLVEPAYWLGKYSDMPHVLSFLNHDYTEIFEILSTDPEVYPLLGPFMTAFKNKAMEQLEGMIGTLRVQISRLATKEAYWIFHKDGDDFDLKVSDPANPSYLLIANDPEKESIIGALNAMILNRLVTRVNSGQGKNVPVSIIVDELPTLYFHKIDNLIATARSNKVSVLLGFQELPQLEANYGKVNMNKITATIGNVISGSARQKETLEWLSNDIFGKVVQMKKGVTINKSETSVNLNENMENLVPASKIADMSTGWLCGQVARDFTPTVTGSNLLTKFSVGIVNTLLRFLHVRKRLKYDESMNIQTAEEFKTSKFFCKTDFDMKKLKAEDDEIEMLQRKKAAEEISLLEETGKKLSELQRKQVLRDTAIFPKFYTFKSTDARERKLYANYNKVNEEIIREDRICELVKKIL